MLQTFCHHFYLSNLESDSPILMRKVERLPIISLPPTCKPESSHPLVIVRLSLNKSLEAARQVGAYFWFLQHEATRTTVISTPC